MADQLTTLLAAVRRRWFMVVALRTCGRAAIAAALVIGGGLAINLALHPTGVALMLLAALAASAALAVAGLILFRMQRRPSDRRVARFVEEHASEVQPGVSLDDELVSAVDLTSHDSATAAGGFAPLVLAHAIQQLKTFEPSQLIPAPAMRRSVIEGAVGAVLLAAALIAGAPALRESIDLAWVHLFPSSVRLTVRPGDTRVAAGRPLLISATLEGRGAGTLAPSVKIETDRETRVVKMTRATSGGAYTLPIESVDRSFRYQVTAGSAASKPFTVTALIPAMVKRIDVHYDYPSFAGLKPRDEEDGGDIYAPSGTKVRLRIHTDKPVTGGALALGGTPSPLALHVASDRVLEAEMVLTKDGSYRIGLSDRDGLQTDGDTEYFIRLMEDRPPVVRIVRPSSDQQITPLEEVAIHARADDDYGIANMALVYSVAGGKERSVPFSALTGTNIEKTGTYLLPAEDLGVKPGDVIAYYAQATDIARGKRATTATSDMFFLEVKPFNEEFVAATSQSLPGAGDPQIESLIAAQKEIISATWNIERRSEAGRSETDVKAIAKAQAELRTRAEQMSAGNRPRRGRDPLAPQRVEPQVPPPQPQRRVITTTAGDPMANAVEAMGRAQAQLEGAKTKDAIADEMTALNGLLQAQAEVKRRQVSQQSGASGFGGGNRQGQDMSALFDKELQRQQKTNYENRSQVEERPDQKDTSDSALDKIRDLARRQEELNRRQRDLANQNLTAEEMKRQLEKLTREQNELRQQAEELAQKRDQNAGAQARQQAQNGAKNAAEEMKGAANDLRRQDAASAAARGERAAEQLRRVEQEMRGGGNAGRERATGELQMEAQQIAQEQRRIATEAERLDKGSGAANEQARKQLADDKERLANRVDDLHRSAQQIAQQPDRNQKGAGAAAAEAARELQQQKVAGKMRESAKDMKQGGKPTAGTEQQIARAMDKVVDALGGATSPEAKKLAEELDQTKGIRDRLNSLEQQMRDAERRTQSGAQGRQGTGPQGQGATRAGEQGKQGDRAQAQQGDRGTGTGKQGDGGTGELDRLRQEYQQELQKAREAMNRLAKGQPQSGLDMGTPEQHEYSRSAPGTEAFKQDRSNWESLRKDVDAALENYEASVSERLSKKLAQDRLSAGGSERVPDPYKRSVAKYYESIAKVKK